MRQQGYYWVRHANGSWKIAFWYEATKEWSICGHDLRLTDADWAEISEQRITLPNYLYVERKT